MSATIKRLKVSLGFVVLYHGIKRGIAPPGGIQMLDWTGNNFLKTVKKKNFMIFETHESLCKIKVFSKRIQRK